jgi:hypothetical protein
VIPNGAQEKVQEQKLEPLYMILVRLKGSASQRGKNDSIERGMFNVGAPYFTPFRYCAFCFLVLVYSRER